MFKKQESERLIYDSVVECTVACNLVYFSFYAFRNHPFSPQRIQQQELGGQGTIGVDAFVTPDRVILLDSQPLLSAAAVDRLATQDAKRHDFTPAENAVETQSLQLTAFLLSVCHVVILMQDWFFDPTLLR